MRISAPTAIFTMPDVKYSIIRSNSEDGSISSDEKANMDIENNLNNNYPVSTRAPSTVRTYQTSYNDILTESEKLIILVVCCTLAGIVLLIAVYCCLRGLYRSFLKTVECHICLENVRVYNWHNRTTSSGGGGSGGPCKMCRRQPR